MGIFDELGKALKQVENEVKKVELEQRAKQAGAGTNHPAPASAQPAYTSNGRSATRSPHPGYQKLAAWMKRNYKDRITTGSKDQFQTGLQLEQLTAEACSGLPAKARKGFLDYLKKQNYEPLLK
jgi:hypothetical protein